MQRALVYYLLHFTNFIIFDAVFIFWNLFFIISL